MVRIRNKRVEGREKQMVKDRGKKRRKEEEKDCDRLIKCMKTKKRRVGNKTVWKRELL